MKFMTESELFLIDTNLLVYAYDEEDCIKRDVSKSFLNNCFEKKVKLAISNQNLAEFVSVTTRKKKLSLEQAKVNVDDILNSDGFVKINYSSSTVLSAIAVAEEHKMSFWDALLAATMKENGIFNIYTENTKDFKMKWIDAVNPFDKD